MALDSFNLKWGHFYDCLDEKRTKLSTPPNMESIEESGIVGLLVPSGTTVQICATGAKLFPTGVEGTMMIKGYMAPSDSEETRNTKMD